MFGAGLNKCGLKRASSKQFKRWTTGTSPHHLWRSCMAMALPSGSGPTSHMNLFSKQHSQAETCTAIFSREILTVAHLAHSLNAGYEHQFHSMMHNSMVRVTADASASPKQVRQDSTLEFNHPNLVHGVDKPDANNQMKRSSSLVLPLKVPRRAPM